MMENDGERQRFDGGGGLGFENGRRTMENVRTKAHCDGGVKRWRTALFDGGGFFAKEKGE
uniref:Uncharacterized protein n=2 Tax=Cucumis melo TaxID=3656 RepID=A0A9I9DD28_CUCME